MNALMLVLFFCFYCLSFRVSVAVRYFMLPHYGEEGVDATGYQSPASVSQTLPIRLVDYFVSRIFAFFSPEGCKDVLLSSFLLCMYSRRFGREYVSKHMGCWRGARCEKITIGRP